MKDNIVMKRSNGATITCPTKPEKDQEALSTCQILRIINRQLIRLFYNFGYNVAQHPLLYTIIPLIISIVLTTGVFFIKFEENPFVLFVPYTAPFLKEQRLVEEFFPMNYSDFYSPSRFTRHEGHSRVIITARDDGSILRPELWPQIMDMDREIQATEVKDYLGNVYNYSDICSKWRGYCQNNMALNLNEIVYEVDNGSIVINYPIMAIPFIVPQVLGGVTINESEGTVDDAKAIVLGYFVQAQTPEKEELAYAWEWNMLQLLHNQDNYDWGLIRASYYTSRSLGDELKVKMDSCLPYIPLTGFIMISSCIGLLWMSDCVRCKPLIGVVGIFSSGMAAGASFGFLIYCGAIYTRLNVVALFLVLGIGVDDIFVAIAAWQKTSVRDPVPKRLAQTYADAAVSVTITSITNALAFAVGTSTPTVIVQNFCLYCGVTIVFAYLWFITFCGGFLALAGYAEKQGRHALFLIKVKPAPENASAPVKKFYSIFCSSPTLRKDTTNEELKPHAVSVFFRDYVGSLLLNRNFKICVLISVFIYLFGAIYGLSVLKEGLYRHRMSRDDSYLVGFSKYDDLYFRHLPYAIQAVITGDIEYSDPETQKKLLQMEKDFEALPHGSEQIYTQSWLRSFTRRLRRRRDWQKNITDEESFIQVLREKFFENPDNRLSLDVKFNDNYTRILASRVIFQTANVTDVYDDVRVMDEYRGLAVSSEFNVTVFHILFSLFDQHTMMRPLAIQSILIAVALVMVVALLFIPDAWGSIAIAFSILSIAAGVIGYMAFWNVNLDHVSAGSIFMCIGFSVDFSAHITYTYLSSKELTSEGKIRESMFSLGLPIIQGGISTILSLITFLFIPGYGYRTFFKTIFLVTIFAAYHSIILIPLFLSTVEDLTRNYRNKKERSAIDSESKEIRTMEIKRIENDSTKDSHFNPTFKSGSIKGKGSYKERNIDEAINANENKFGNNRDAEIKITDICKQSDLEPNKDERSSSSSTSEESESGSNQTNIEVEEGTKGVENRAYIDDENKEDTLQYPIQ